MIQNVVFDIGRVLISYDPEKYVSALGIDVKVCDYVFYSPLWHEWDRGTYSYTDFIDKCCENAPAQYEDAIRTVLKEEWMDILTPKWDTVAFMEDLKQKGYHIYLLSNFSKEGFLYIENKYDFWHLADGKVISYEVQMLKPEPEIYQKLICQYKLNPAETVFLDDLVENIAAAKSAGLEGIVFTELAQVVKQFESLVNKGE